MTGVPSVKVTARLGITVIDGPDQGDDQDGVWCDSGFVRLTPLNPETTITGTSAGPWLAGNHRLDIPIGVDGNITWQGNPWVKVVDFTSDHVNPQVPPNRATHQVEYVDCKAGDVSVDFKAKRVRLAADMVDPATGTCDLVKLSPVPTAGGTPITRGEAGRGIAALDVAGNVLVATFTDGSTVETDLPAALVEADAALAGAISNPESLTGAALNAAIGDSADPEAGVLATSSGFVLEDPKGRRFAKSCAPGLTFYPPQRRPHHRFMYQHGDTVYAVAQHAAYVVLKSTDFGQTWTRKGTLPSGSTSLIRVEGTNTLLSVDISNYTSVGTPKIRRSTDDGTTWTEVHALRFPTLSYNGLVVAKDGSILVAEYGNVAGEVYRVLRSTDDGVTWTVVLSSPGGDPAADPGHIHSIAVDPYSGNLIAFMDRTNPDVYVSTNHGASFTLLGSVTDVKHPNWVQPMFFPEHIVWGTDNQSNGRICRIKYADFYAGDFDKAEVISLTNRKAFYYTFPLRTDAWLVTQSTEVIAPGAEPHGPGSYYSEVYLVTDEGATVSAGYEQINLRARAGTLQGQRARVPAFHWSSASSDISKGRTWVSEPNFYGGTIETFTGIPVTQGYAPQARVSRTSAPLVPTSHAQWYPGWWYGAESRGNGTETIVAGRMTLTPMWIPHPIRLDKIACEVATATAGATVKMVIYEPDMFDRPWSKIYESAAQDASTSGLKEIFIDSPIPDLRPGLYFVGAVAVGGDVLMRTIGTGHIPGLPAVAFRPGVTGTGSEPNCFYQDAASTPPAALTTWAQTTHGIKVMVRASA